MATTNPLKEYWRNQQKKVTDRKNECEINCA